MMSRSDVTDLATGKWSMGHERNLYGSVAPLQILKRSFTLFADFWDCLHCFLINIGSRNGYCSYQGVQR